MGKTTSAITLAGLLSREGKSVLLVDLDPQGSLSSYFGYNPDQQQLSSYTLFEKREQLSAGFVAGLIQPMAEQNCFVLPASLALATLERQAIGRDGMGLVLSRALKLVSDKFDYAIIDSHHI